jgi:hypothetical protein
VKRRLGKSGLTAASEVSYRTLDTDSGVRLGDRADDTIPWQITDTARAGPSSRRTQ